MTTKETFIAASANTLHHDDCITVMRGIPDGVIDLIVVDPPYLIDYFSTRRKLPFARIAGDRSDISLIDQFLFEAHRTLKMNAAIYMFCSWHHIEQFKASFDRVFTTKNLIVWNKNVHGTGDLKGAFAPKHELILFGHKGRSLNRGKRLPDVLDAAKVKGLKALHPTEKPVDLLTKLIANSSDEGDIVLDAFAGSGSTCEAAKLLRRHYVAIDIDAANITTIKNRIQ